MAGPVWMKSNAYGDSASSSPLLQCRPISGAAGTMLLELAKARSRSHGAGRVGGRRVRWFVGAGVRLIGASRETRRSQLVA